MKYLGGDYGTSGRCRLEKGLFSGGLKRLVVSGRLFHTWKIKAKDIMQVEEVNESKKVKVLRGIGGAALGTLLAGPIGLLAGAFFGGRRGKRFIVVIRDRWNRKLLCAVNQKEYELLLAAQVANLRN
jgi:hypothetical protein